MRGLLAFYTLRQLKIVKERNNVCMNAEILAIKRAKDTKFVIKLGVNAVQLKVFWNSACRA